MYFFWGKNSPDVFYGRRWVGSTKYRGFDRCGEIHWNFEN